MAAHKALHNYYAQQAKGGHPAYYIGPSYQRGHGLGGIFSSLFRAAIPIFKSVSPALKQGAKALAREAITTGANIATDALKGEDWKESASKHSKAAAKTLISSGASKLTRMLDDKRNVPNSNTRRYNKRRKTIKASKLNKRQRDIFD